jgi:hypothetical protein
MLTEHEVPPNVCVTGCEVDQQEQLSGLMRMASESVADNELCPFNALVSALTAGRRMTSHVDMLRRSNPPSHVGR